MKLGIFSLVAVTLALSSCINKARLAPGNTAAKSPIAVFSELINLLIKILSKLGVLRRDLDYHVVRASMVIIYFFFGYQKWYLLKRDTDRASLSTASAK